ncbi:MAG: two-component system response regulator, partial [Gammaproteobacteria bacterium]
MANERIVSEKATVLCVDDEPEILSALSRFLRRERYDVLTAQSGAAGLDLLRRHMVDVVISDMRMPEMDGTEFLAEVAHNWPETVRILLTGYADISATIDAINQGEIFRYVSKPWDEDKLRQTVRSGMEKVYLEQVRRDLEKATRHQAISIADLNTDAEQELRVRNEQLQHRVDKLGLEQLQGRRDFGDTVRVLANMAECFSGNQSGHSRRVADLARDIAEHLKLPMPQLEIIHLAALLHAAGEGLGAQAPPSA